MRKSVNLPENITSQEDAETPPLMKLDGKRLLRPKDVLRIHSRLIQGFIKKEITGDDAKTLAYLCTAYLQSYNATVQDERLKAIEKQLDVITKNNNTGFYYGK